MTDDPLPYGLFYQEALRGIMRRALSVVAEQGLPGDHYFHITFRTDHPDVVMPKALRAQYPTEMAIILQHMFDDLEVDDSGFSVTLSFNRVQQRLTVPLEAVTAFQDPPANVVLTFLDADPLLAVPDLSEAEPASGTEVAGAAQADEQGGSEEGDNVIAIDRFRKN